MYAGLVYVLETVVGGGLADDEVVVGGVVVVVVITSCLANILTLPLPSKIKELIFTARKQNLWQGNVLHLSMILFTGGCLTHCMLG